MFFVVRRWAGVTAGLLPGRLRMLRLYMLLLLPRSLRVLLLNMLLRPRRFGMLLLNVLLWLRGLRMLLCRLFCMLRLYVMSMLLWRRPVFSLANIGLMCPLRLICSAILMAK